MQRVVNRLERMQDELTEDDRDMIYANTAAEVESRRKALEVGADDKRHRAPERGVPPPHQDPDRPALRCNRADASLGADGIGPDPDAQSGWLGNLGSAHRSDQP